MFVHGAQTYTANSAMMCTAHMESRAGSRQEEAEQGAAGSCLLSAYTVVIQSPVSQFKVRGLSHTQNRPNIRFP